MIPYIATMLLATRPSLSNLYNRYPPATAASKPTRPRPYQASLISRFPQWRGVPCWQSPHASCAVSLLDKLLCRVYPPYEFHHNVYFRIVEYFLGIWGEQAPGKHNPLSLWTSLSAILLRTISKPILSEITALFSRSIFTVPVPTVPKTDNPTVTLSFPSR